MSHRPKITALLPLKKNSVRVPNKNFRDFSGKPLFRWVLDTLLVVNEIDQIVINTDAKQSLLDHGLLESSRIVIRDRKPEICGDHVSMNRVLADDLSHLEAEIFLMTHTTNPFLSEDTIRKALASFQTARKEKKADSLFSVDKVQSRFYRSDATAINHDPDHLIPTQDLVPWYQENSNLYIFTADSFSKTNARIGKKPMLFESPRFESIDIDTPADWEFATIAARYLREKSAQ